MVTQKSRGQVRIGAVLPGLTGAKREDNLRANSQLGRERLDPSCQQLSWDIRVSQPGEHTLLNRMDVLSCLTLMLARKSCHGKQNENQSHSVASKPLMNYL